MKKISILFLFFTVFVINLVAGALDPYNTVVLISPISQSSINTMIANRLEECLEYKGFKVIRKDKPEEESPTTLILEWSVDVGYGYPSTLSVKFYDSSFKPVANYAETGNSFTLNGDMNIASKKIVKSLNETPYTFRPKVDHNSKFPPILITEDSIRTYLSSNNVAPIEGIYKTIGSNWIRFAIIKQKSRYAAYILEASSKEWKFGDIKAYFEPIKKDIYSTTFLDFGKKVKESLAHFDGTILEVAVDNNSDNDWEAIKIFPNNESSEVSSNLQSSDVVGSGSGFFISDRIVATNYHVVEDAQKLKVIVKDGNTVESYNARVLVSDKTNDLALLSIVDRNFSGMKDIPYSLSEKTIEVGTSVFAMGYPLSNYLGDEIKVTDGIVNSRTGFQGDITTYQISAPIQPGNSGGALFDKSGVLVGITNAGVSKAENVGYAIKTVYLKNLIEAAPIYIDLPTGRNLSGLELTKLIKVLTPYVVFIEVY